MQKLNKQARELLKKALNPPPQMGQPPQPLKPSTQTGQAAQPLKPAPQMAQAPQKPQFPPYKGQNYQGPAQNHPILQNAPQKPYADMTPHEQAKSKGTTLGTGANDTFAPHIAQRYQQAAQSQQNMPGSQQANADRHSLSNRVQEQQQQTNRNAVETARYQQFQTQQANQKALAGGKATTTVGPDGSIVENKPGSYAHVQQQAMQQHPELAQAGSPMNKAFLEIMHRNGGSEALRQNPNLINDYAQQAKRQLEDSGTMLANNSNQREIPKAKPSTLLYENQDVTGSPSPDFAASTQGTQPTQPNDSLLTSPPIKNNFDGNVSLGLDGKSTASAAPSTPSEPSEYDEMPEQSSPVASNDETPREYGEVQRGNFRKEGAQKIKRSPVQNSAYNDYLKMKPSPASPYVGQRASFEDLTSFPISEDDWMKGGGMLSFAEKPGASLANPKTPISATVPARKSVPKILPKKKISMLPSIEDMRELAADLPAGPSIAPKLAAMLLEKKAEQEILSYFNSELKKTAGAVYSSEEIDEFTSSTESFEKAAAAEASVLWAGVEDELRKQGANDDFIMGMMKEAEHPFWEATKKTLGFGKEASPQAVAPGATAADPAQFSLKGWEGQQKIRSDARKYIIPALEEHAMRQSKLGIPVKFDDFTIPPIPGVHPKALEVWKQTELPGVMKDLNNYATNWTNGVRPTSFTPKPSGGAAGAGGHHEIIPGVGNNWTGALGGALLSSLVGSSMGLEGPAAWLMPILGGVAGYKFMPKLMDMWKGTPGERDNPLHPATARTNNKQPAPAMEAAAKPMSLDRPVTLGLGGSSAGNVPTPAALKNIVPRALLGGANSTTAPATTIPELPSGVGSIDTPSGGLFNVGAR